MEKKDVPYSGSTNRAAPILKAQNIPDKVPVGVTIVRPVK
ncbi:hypothetical protein FACS1894202_00860 [Clostridia bacterium]|nr:hypothetical protein FACS1894202_00860 [Clostridia bacterium]